MTLPCSIFWTQISRAPWHLLPYCSTMWGGVSHHWRRGHRFLARHGSMIILCLKTIVAMLWSTRVVAGTCPKLSRLYCCCITSHHPLAHAHFYGANGGSISAKRPSLSSSIIIMSSVYLWSQNSIISLLKHPSCSILAINHCCASSCSTMIEKAISWACTRRKPVASSLYRFAGCSAHVHRLWAADC